MAAAVPSASSLPRVVLPCLLGCLLAAALAAAGSDYSNAKRKIELIEQDRAPAGSVVLSQSELNAYFRAQVPTVAPQGVRDPRLELGAGRAAGFAYIDFPRLRQAQGQPMNWFLARLLAGERPVRVEARIRSGGGQATVEVERVEISGISISGDALDFLIRNFLWSYYPDAKLGKPFELAHRIDRLEVQPSQVRVVIGR